MTTRKFEIRNQMGQGDIKAIITIECDTILNNELDFVVMDLEEAEPSPIIEIKMGQGYDHKEVKI